ncbi:MAG: quinol:cytochrome C oxidoreductase, partial [Myxococcota bacterium]
MIEFATKAGWSVVVRRIAEALASNLRWLWIAFIPIAVGMWFSDTTGLYEWAMSSAAHDEVLVKKAAFLNKGFWLARSALYFLIWAWLANFYLRTSSAQDATGSPELTLRMQGRSYVGILLVGLSLTFASIDWIMSLEPRWFSTIFGVYFFAGAFCGFFAAMIVILKLLQRSGRLTHTITREHYQDLGKLLFAFGIVFWAYIAYSQFMLIWYASLPEETTFYLIRMLGEWRVIGLLLIFGHFFGPFLAILSRHAKRNEQWLLVAAVWMLFMQFIDVYWLVMPHVPVQAIAEARNYPELQEQFKDLSVGFTLVHPVTLAAMVALLVAGTAFALRNRSLIPERDPRLRESL